MSNHRSTRSTRGSTEPTSTTRSTRSTRGGLSSSSSLPGKDIRKKRMLLNLLAIGLLVAGIGLLAVQPVINYFIAPNALEKAYANDLDHSEMAENEAKLRELAAVEDLFDFSQVSHMDMMDVQPKLNRESIIGGIYIPSVDVNLPILYGSTDANMRVATGTLKPEQSMGVGNYALASHNAKNQSILFAPLRFMDEGDMIYLTDKKQVYGYRTTSMEVVEPERVDVIQDKPGEELVTLVVCYSDDGSDRLIVQGQLEEVTYYTESDKKIQKAFDPL